MPITYVYDGTDFQPISGVPGSTGPAGPTAISNDAGNQSVLGSDSLIYTPEFASGVYLPLAGGAMTGDISFSPYDGGLSGAIGFDADNQGVSLNLGDKSLGADTVTPFIDFYMGTDVIAGRLIASGSPNGVSRDGLLTFQAGTVKFDATIQSAPASPSTPQILLGSGALLGSANTNFLFYPNAADTDTYLIIGSSGSIELRVPAGQNNSIIRASALAFQAVGIGFTTTAGVPNVNTSSIGTLIKSSAVTAGMVAPDEVALSARTGLTLIDIDLEGIDLALLINYILDQIDALEVFHP
jgi:hypothetical protein